MSTASEHSLASRIGAEILVAGGSAADAAIATALAVGTLNPYHSCIGGGGFAVVRGAAGGVKSVDFRVTAPAAATAEFYKTADTNIGGAAVGVPGEVRGFAALHAKYGKLPWTAVLAPSIKLCGGMPMGKDLYDYLAQQCPSPPAIAGSWMESDPEFVRTFSRDGILIPEGDTWVRPEYAATLAAIAADPEAFYAGPSIPAAIAGAVQARGGLMTVDDIQQYQPVWRTPLSAKFKGYKVYAPPAPASGAVLLAALQTLDALGGPKGPVTDVAEAHDTIEALRLAYGQRTLLGDPAFVAGLGDLQAAWLADGQGAVRAATVGPTTKAPEAYLATNTAAKDDHGTSHIAAVDASGQVCSITTTIGQLWAARIMVPGTGIMLNDSMDDFSVAGKSNAFGYAPSAANYIVGGRRPLSSQCPYLVEDAAGRPAFVGGSAGGSTIISANVQVIRNLITHGMTAREALSAPRLHDMVLPNKTVLERATHRGGPVVGWSEAEADALRSRGHDVEWVAKTVSTPCCIRILADGGYDAAGDPRKFDAAGAVA